MQQINVSPFTNTTHLLSLVGRQTLCTQDGRKVEIMRGRNDVYAIWIDDDPSFVGRDADETSRYLNSLPLYVREGA